MAAFRPFPSSTHPFIHSTDAPQCLCYNEPASPPGNARAGGQWQSHVMSSRGAQRRQGQPCRALWRLRGVDMGAGSLKDEWRLPLKGKESCSWGKGTVWTGVQRHEEELGVRTGHLAGVRGWRWDLRGLWKEHWAQRWHPRLQSLPKVPGDLGMVVRRGQDHGLRRLTCLFTRLFSDPSGI